MFFDHVIWDSHWDLTITDHVTRDSHWELAITDNMTQDSHWEFAITDHVTRDSHWKLGIKGHVTRDSHWELANMVLVLQKKIKTSSCCNRVRKCDVLELDDFLLSMYWKPSPKQVWKFNENEKLAYLKFKSVVL